MNTQIKRMLSAIAVVLAASLAACDSNNIAVSGGETPPSTTQAMNPGDWQMTGPFTSGAASIAGSDSNMTLTVLLPAATQNGSCGASLHPNVFTGAVNGTTVTFTSQPIVAGSSEIMTITGIARYGTNLDATFTVTGASSTDPCYGATGHFGTTGLAAGSFVPPPNGTWAGTVTETENDPVSNGFINSYPLYVSATITEATVPDANVRFPLSGTVTFNGSLCYPEGISVPIDSAKSFMVGDQISLSVVDNDGGEILYADNLPGSERSNGPDPYYSTTPTGVGTATFTQGTMSFASNTADNQIYNGVCGYFEWNGMLLNPPAPILPMVTQARH